MTQQAIAEYRYALNDNGETVKNPNQQWWVGLFYDGETGIFTLKEGQGNYDHGENITKDRTKALSWLARQLLWSPCMRLTPAHNFISELTEKVGEHLSQNGIMVYKQD